MSPRAYVTSNGRAGVSFGFFGSLVVGFLYLCGLVLVAAGAVVVLVAMLVVRLWRHLRAHRAVQPPPPDPWTGSEAPLLPPNPGIEAGEVVTLYDSEGRAHVGMFLNKESSTPGKVTFDWLEDPLVHSEDRADI